MVDLRRRRVMVKEGCIMGDLKSLRSMGKEGKSMIEMRRSGMEGGRNMVSMKRIM